MRLYGVYMKIILYENVVENMILCGKTKQKMELKCFMRKNRDYFEPISLGTVYIFFVRIHIVNT